MIKQTFLCVIMNEISGSDVILAAVLVAMAGIAASSSAADSAREKLKREYEALPTVEVFGKVCDTEGDPISDADVRVAWDQATAFGLEHKRRDAQLKTDESGMFQYACPKPFWIMLSACKAGYEPPNGDGEIRVSAEKTMTTPDQPVVIRLRKIGPTTFLVIYPGNNQGKDELFWTKGGRSVSVPLDILSRVGEKTAMSCEDVRIDASLDAMGKYWTVTYTATNEMDGLILSDRMLYEAPATGYVRQVSVRVTERYQKCYLYIRSRVPAIYTRILFEQDPSHDSHDGESLRLFYKEWVNPYGERNLEYETAMESQYLLRKQMEREIKADFRQNKRPEKPDLPKRIREFNEKLQKEKKNSNGNAK